MFSLINELHLFTKSNNRPSYWAISYFPFLQKIFFAFIFIPKTNIQFSKHISNIYMLSLYDGYILRQWIAVQNITLQCQVANLEIEQRNCLRDWVGILHKNRIPLHQTSKTNLARHLIFTRSCKRKDWNIKTKKVTYFYNEYYWCSVCK